MIGRFRKSLAWRMAFYFGLLVVVSLVLSASLGFFYGRQTIRDAVFANLTAFRTVSRERLQEYFQERVGFVRLISRSREVAELLAFAAEGQASGGGATEESGSRRYGMLAQRAHKRLSSDEAFGAFDDLVLMASEKLTVLYTSREGLQSVSNESAHAKRLKALEGVWKQVTKKKGAVLGEMAFYEPLGKVCFFVGVPVLDDQGTMSAVLVAALNIEHLKGVVEDRTGLGQTGDAYLVGADAVLRTPSRFLAEGEVLKRKVETEAVRRVLAGETGEAVVTDYRGQKVLSAFAPLGLKDMDLADFDWGLLVEIDAEEAFAAVSRLAVRSLLITLVLAGLAVGVGFLTSQRVVRPIKTLSTVASQVARGDLSVSVEETVRQDEVGELISGFRSMLESLRGQIHQVSAGVNDLAGSISQISATAAQLAASSSETATAISEITTTMEEVRQTARLAHDKAKQVAQRAEMLSQTAHDGRNVAGEALNGLERIREQMDFVAENVMRLSEQGRSIGDIIDVVRDLADQVNLLSVNAAIEAAKAGEHGKGFAVVAQEMRSLADQSKEATEQVKQILSEVQRATGGAVMAIEQGNKAVAAGLDLGRRADEAISRLALGVEETSDAAVQIASSSQEQLVGIEQLVLAVQNIREASGQNTEAARQLEGAVRDLERLSRALREIASRVRL
uniref:Methyl-accepting chemotaxis protein n=1 Tax=Desulfacinum infernum TaxID=35837 RepID=A0A831ZMV8_9BACT